MTSFEIDVCEGNAFDSFFSLFNSGVTFSVISFQSGINISKVLSAKRKLEAKRKRQEKKMVKQMQKVRM